MKESLSPGRHGPQSKTNGPENPRDSPPAARVLLASGRARRSRAAGTRTDYDVSNHRGDVVLGGKSRCGQMTIRGSPRRFAA